MNRFPKYLISILITSPLLANSGTNLFDLSLEELLEVEVTIASKTTHTTQSSPSSVTVYTREEIRQMGISSLEGLLNFVPGVQVTRVQLDAVWGNGIFRGRGGQQGTNPSVLIILDGRRINNHQFGGGFDNELNNLDWIKQVEIIRGPGSALYGANAFMGVINLVSDIKENEIHLRVGQPGLREASLQLNQQLGDLDIELYLQDYQDDGEDYSPFYSFIGFSEATQDPFGRETLALKLSYHDFFYDLYHSDSIREDFVIGSTLNDEVNSFATDYSSSRFGYDGFKGSDWHIQLFYDHFEYSSDAQLAIVPPGLEFVWWTDGSTDKVIGGNYRRIESSNFGLSGSYQVSSSHNLTYGIEYREEQVDDNPFQGNWDPEVMVSSRGSEIIPCDCLSRGFYFNGELANFINASNRYTSNYYIQDEWNVSEDLLATFGIRRDTYNDFGGNTSLRASFVYQAATNSQLKLIYGEAFRAPSFSESRALIASNFIGNPDLRPELVETLDLVWSQKYNATNLSLTYTQSTITDEIQLVLQADDVISDIQQFQPQNIGKTDLESVEFEINGVLFQESHWRYHLGYTHYMDSTGLGVTDDLAFFIINYGHSNWNLNINGHYQGESISRLADGTSILENIRLDDFWRVNLNLNYQYTDNLTIYVRGENIFDEQNFTYARGQGLEDGLPNRGRLLSAGLYWAF